MEATKKSIDRGMDKEDVVHTYNGILLSHKKKKIMPFTAKWKDLEIVIRSEVRERKTNIICGICGILKKWYQLTYLRNRNRVTDVENKRTVTKGESEGGGINWETGVDIYTLLYIK